MSGEHQADVNVVVNGQPIAVRIQLNAPLHVLIQHALKDSGNSGQPTENWELRDAAGEVLDVTRKAEDYRIVAGANLFLNLKAGIGG